jgi:lysophospholipase L1-like esterase
MKRFLFLCLLSTLHAETRDLILVAGQSNAVGFDAYATELPADASDKDVMFWWRVGDPPPDEHDVTSGGKWTHLQPQPKGSPKKKNNAARQYGNFEKAEGGFGPEIGFARELKAKEGKPLAIIKAAFSGTAVAQDWNPDDPGIGGSCYRALVETVKSALAAAKAQNLELKFRALVWVQGESDATSAYAPLYTKNLAHMLTRLRSDLAAPQLIALIGVNTRFGNGKNPNMPVVIASQKAIDAQDPLAVYVDTEGAETLPPSHTHFTAKGTLEIGRRYAAALLAFKPGQTSTNPPKGEPTNAAEAAAQKAKADAEVEAKYQALVAKLPADQLAWERVLQDQLGGFYLPIHKREKISSRSSAWDFVQDDPKLPRVLLIGDSVSRGYTQAVRKVLAGKVNVHRAPANCGPTASGLKNIEVWLGDGKWDLIHFNFGIHDRATPIADYQQRLEQLIERMKKTGAKLVWASSTPCPDTKNGQYKSAPILERNTAAAEVMKKHGIAIDDLFTAITPHLATMQNPDDVHFTGQGYDFLGETVAKAIEAALK